MFQWSPLKTTAGKNSLGDVKKCASRMPAKYRYSMDLCVLIENVFCMGMRLHPSPQACLLVVPGGASAGTDEK